MARGGSNGWPLEGRRRVREGIVRFGLLGVAVLLVFPLLSMAVPQPTDVPASVSPVGPHSHLPASATPGASSYPTPIRHVFVIYLENAELSSVQSNGPYEMGLATNYTQASKYYAPCHPSAPEYLAGTSGATWQCGSDSVHQGGYSTSNIGYLAQKAGLSWGGYMESMPSRCDASDSYPYAARHDPFVYYSDISGSVCTGHVANFTAWDANVTAGTIPSFAFFSPNLKNDGHDTSVSYADSWLKGWLPTYLKASWFNSSVWFITYDEGSSNSGYASFSGGHVYFTAVSPYTTGGHSFTNSSTHYNLLSTVEWLLGLGGTGNNDSTANFPPMKGLFHFSSPSEYLLGGTVGSSTTGQPIAGATVAVPGGPSTTTSSTGTYALALPNGTFPVTASATGFTSATVNLTISGSNLTQDFALAASSNPPPEYDLRGVVEYRDNASPIGGAEVALNGGPFAPTGPNATFGFREPNGTYALTAWAAGCASVAQNVTVSGRAVNLTVLLPSFRWEVFGHVVDAGTGQFIVGANLSVASGPLPGPVSSLTDANGAYAMWLPNGTFSISVYSPGYDRGTRTLVVAGAPLPENVSLVSAPSSERYALTGMVTYGTNGSPAPGVSVEVAPSAATVTGSNGAFSVLLSNGSYSVEARDPGWHAGGRSITIAGAPTSVNLVLEETTYAITGVVRFADGGPVAQVVLTTEGSTASATTGPDGTYALALPNGTFVLRATGPGILAQDLTVVVAGGPVVQNVNVTASTASTGSPPMGGAGLPWALAVIVVLAAGAIVVVLRAVRRAPPRGS